MVTALLILHLLVTLTLIGTILIQRSEGGGLGIGTSQGMGAFMTGRGTANFLTRTTAILAGLFMVLSLVLAILNRGGASYGGHDILSSPPPPPSSVSIPAPTAILPKVTDKQVSPTTQPIVPSNVPPPMPPPQ